MTRYHVRIVLALAAITTSLVAAAAQPVAGSESPKTLRYAFRSAETGFDPAQISDIYSRIVTGHIFDEIGRASCRERVLMPV